MTDFFAIPTTSVVLSNIQSWTGAFFLPFLGPVLFIAGIFIAAAIAVKVSGLMKGGVVKVMGGGKRIYRRR